MMLEIYRKLIEEYTVTDAYVHDSQAVEQLLTEKDEGKPLSAESAYTGKDQETFYIKKKNHQQDK